VGPLVKLRNIRVLYQPMQLVVQLKYGTPDTT